MLKFGKQDREKHLRLIVQAGIKYDSVLPHDLQTKDVAYELPHTSYYPDQFILLSDAFAERARILKRALEALTALSESNLISPAVILGYKSVIQIAGNMAWNYRGKDRKEHTAFTDNWRYLPRHFDGTDHYLAFFLLAARDSLPGSIRGFFSLQRSLGTTGLYITPNARLGSQENPENLDWRLRSQGKLVPPGKVSPPELNRLVDLSKTRNITAARVKHLLNGKRDKLNLQQAETTINAMLKGAAHAETATQICRSHLAKAIDWPIEQRLIDLYQMSFDDDLNLEKLQNPLAEIDNFVRCALEIESAAA